MPGKVKLTVQERLTLGNMLAPLANDFDTLKIIRKAREDLSFTPLELKKWEIERVPVPGSRGVDFNWRTLDKNDKPIDQNAEIEIGEIVTSVIVKTLKELNELKQLRDFHFSLYEKFVNGAKSG